MRGVIDNMAPVRAGPTGRAPTLERRLKRALGALESAQRARLEEAETSVTLRVDGGLGVVVLLDRHGPRVDQTATATEIHIELDRSLAASFLDGSVALACALMQGTARAWGPVRKYLGVDPIIRAVLAETADADHA